LYARIGSKIHVPNRSTQFDCLSKSSFDILAAVNDD
jgi:hypothetical protein